MAPTAVLTPRLTVALEKLRSLAQAGVVMGPSKEIAMQLGFNQTRSLRHVSLELERAGLLSRENSPGRGANVRLILKDLNAERNAERETRPKDLNAERNAEREPRPKGLNAERNAERLARARKYSSLSTSEGNSSSSSSSKDLREDEELSNESEEMRNGAGVKAERRNAEWVLLNRLVAAVDRLNERLERVLLTTPPACHETPREESPSDRPQRRPRARTPLWGTDGASAAEALAAARAVLEVESRGKDVSARLADLQLYPLEHLLRAIADVRLRAARGRPLASPTANLWDALTRLDWGFEEGAVGNLESVEETIRRERGAALAAPAPAPSVPLESEPAPNPERERQERLRSFYDGLPADERVRVDARARAEASGEFVPRGTILDDSVLGLLVLRKRDDLLERMVSPTSFTLPSGDV